MKDTYKFVDIDNKKSKRPIRGLFTKRVMIIAIVAIFMVLLYISSTAAPVTEIEAFEKSAASSVTAEKTPAAAVNDNVKAPTTVNNLKSGAIKDTKTPKLQGTSPNHKFGYVNPEDEDKSYPRRNATFVTLARNSDINGIMKAIQMVEDHYNRFYHYDWVFLNNEPFSDEFKELTSSLISGTTKYGLIPKEHWSYPEHIDQNKAAEGRKRLEEQKVLYASSESYRHMCRFESGFFYRHELLADYKYYWRVEPDVVFPCNIDFDVFAFMEDNDKEYAFTTSLYEYPATIETLWKTTKEFIKANPEYIAQDNLMEFISDDKGENYNNCHFWSNFEVGKLDLWRGEAYSKYFEHLDQAGGFFYERWGDAPVHSIAASLFLPKDKVHRFDEIGYTHIPFTSCPTDSLTRKRLRCTCKAEDNFTWKGYSCASKFYDAKKLDRPAGWQTQT